MLSTPDELISIPNVTTPNSPIKQLFPGSLSCSQEQCGAQYSNCEPIHSDERSILSAAGLLVRGPADDATKTAAYGKCLIDRRLLDPIHYNPTGWLQQTGYYDMNYQTQSSLGAAGVRGDGTYSTMTSDGRFARTDNNSSPVSNVPSTMSQQQAQAGSGGPMLNLPYAYFYGGNVMPGAFQYGTPVYPQQMATTNATSGGQFPKPNAYNSGYGSSSYDSLNQSSQDYSKSGGGYQSAGVGQQQSKGQSVNNPQQSGTGSDISSSMYGKSHGALNKVNVSRRRSLRGGGATDGDSNCHVYIFVLSLPVLREAVVPLGHAASIQLGGKPDDGTDLADVRDVHFNATASQHQHAPADAPG